MRDLAGNIRAYVEVAAPAVTVEEVLTQARADAERARESAERPWWRSPVAVVASATLAVLVAVGGVTLALRSLVGGEVAGEDPTSPARGVSLPIGEDPRTLVAADGTLFLSAGDALVRFDPATGTETGRVDGLGPLSFIAVYDGHLWVGGERLWHIDPDRMEIIGSVIGVGVPGTAGHGSIWTGVYTDHTEDDTTEYPAGRPEGAAVARIDPASGEITAVVSLEDAACPPGAGGSGGVDSLAATSEAVWAFTNCSGEGRYVTIQRIDPATNQVGRVVVLLLSAGSQALDLNLLVVEDQIWGYTTVYTEDEDLGDMLDGRVYRVTAADEPEPLANVGQSPRGAVYAGGSVWVTDCLDGTLTRLDVETGSVRGLPVIIGTPAPPAFDWFAPEGFTCPSSIAAVGNTLWISGSVDGTLIPVYLDPASAPGPTVTVAPGPEPPGVSTTLPTPETTEGPPTTMTDDGGGPGTSIPPEAAGYAARYDELIMDYVDVEESMLMIELPPDAEPCEFQAGPDACDPETPEGQLGNLQRRQGEILDEITALLDEMAAAGIAYPWTCSTSGYDPELVEQPDLPAEVAATLRTVFEAALDCDWEALSPVVGPETVDQWRRGEMLPPGGRPMENLVDTLMLSYGTYVDGDGQTVYVWPSAVTAAEWSDVPEEDRLVLVGMYGEGVAGEFAEWGFVNGRAFIRADGVWAGWVVGT